MYGNKSPHITDYQQDVETVVTSRILLSGQLQQWDIERPSKPIFSVQAHTSLVNRIDGCGGQVRVP
jgi:hypothetical protein